MKCNYCGAEIDKETKFCTNCGKEVAGQAPIEPGQAPITPNGQPPQKKGSNVGLIIALVVIGIFVLFGVGIAVLFGTFYAKVKNTIEELPTIDDYTYDDSEDGEVVKTVKDPTGHEIKIVKDSIYVIKVDTDYLYDKAREARKHSKVLTEEEAEKLEGTTREREATKAAIKELNDYVFNTQSEIEEQLKENGYSAEEVKYAIEHCGADWKEQAVIEAMIHLAAGGSSKESVMDLMEYDGYSKELATYAANYEKHDYYEQALYDAVYLRYTYPKYGGSGTKEDTKSMLEYDKYTEDEINFALKVVYEEMEEKY